MRNLLSYGLGKPFAVEFSSLKNQHKVAQGYISKKMFHITVSQSFF